MAEIDLPVLRNDGSVEENLNENAINNILPARYTLEGEEPTEVFERVAKNISVAELVWVEDNVQIRPKHIKPDHPRRDNLIEEVFGTDDLKDDADVSVTVSEENAKYVSYDAIIDDLDTEARSILKDAKTEFTDLMENLKFTPNSPTLMNAGGELQQLSACFVISPDDDIDEIHDTAREAADVFQSGGGMGYGFWTLRPKGSPVGSTGGVASGPITFMRTYDQMCETIAQGGSRRGAQMGIMKIDHPDVIEFIHAKRKDVSLADTLRLNDPDDFTHTSFGEALEEARDLIDENGKVPEHLRNAVEGHLSNFNISVGVTDEFMDAVENDELFKMRDPNSNEPYEANPKTVETYEWFGLGEYVTVGEPVEIPARELWDHIIEGAHENGEPGVVFIERFNKEHSFPVDTDEPLQNQDYSMLATNPCVTGDTKVATADGRGGVEIQELVGEDDVPVYTRKGEDAQVGMASNIRKTCEDAELVEIETENGVNLRLTPDHPVWTYFDGWVDAGELSSGQGVQYLYEVSDSKVTVESDKVVSVDSAGSEDVYDLEVPGTRNFYASQEGGEYINIHNCGEQPLMEYEACNLGHINLSTIVDENAEEWFELGDNAADLTNEVESFLNEAINLEELNHRIEVGTRFLDNVVTMSDFPVEEIEETVSNNRKIGLGVMGLAQMFIQLGVEYGTDEGDEIARQVMQYINHRSKAVSHDLADDRGVFANWEDSKYADPTEYREWFEKQTGLDATDSGFEMRNHNTTTIAPTGTTSMIGDTSGGCEPIYSVGNFKNVSDDVQGDEMLKQFDSLFLQVLRENDIDVETVKDEIVTKMEANEFGGVNSLESVPQDIADLFVTTSDLSALQHAGIQCAMQEGVDSAISKTVNAPNDASLDDTRNAFEFVYENGGKGVTYYRDGTRSKQVLTTRADNQSVEDDVEVERVTDDYLQEELGMSLDEVQSLANSSDNGLQGGLDKSPGHTPQDRPDTLSGRTYRVKTGYGRMYVTVNDLDGEPFEVIATIGKSGGLIESMLEGLARMASSSLRAGMDVDTVIDQLKGIRAPKTGWDNGDQIQSIPDGIAKVLIRHVGDDPSLQSDAQSKNMVRDAESVDDGTPQEKNVIVDGGNQEFAGICPECPDEGEINMTEGCKTCEVCGWSEC